MDVPDAGVGAAEGGVQAGVEEPVLVHFVEAEGDVERRRLGVAVLTGEVVEQPVGGHGEIQDAALEEVACEGGLGRHDELGRLGRRRRRAEDVAEPAEVLPVGALPGAHLCDGEAEHARNVYLSPCSGTSRSGARSAA
jgi:hypothetical protein